MKKLHFKFYRYILSIGYPFDHWLILLRPYLKLWIISSFYSLIIGLIFQISSIDYLKFYCVIIFLFMIFSVFLSYKLKFFILIYDTIEQLFRLTIGRLFGLKPINFYYEPTKNKKYFEKNVLYYDEERTKVFEKKYEEIDFLVLNDYITIEEGNKRTDELLKKEYGYGFRVTLGGHYETVNVD